MDDDVKCQQCQRDVNEHGCDLCRKTVSVDCGRTRDDIYRAEIERLTAKYRLLIAENVPLVAWQTLRADRDRLAADLRVTNEILEGTVEDKNELIDERDKLRAENATLAAERDSAALRCAELTAERDRLAAEADELRTLNNGWQRRSDKTHTKYLAWRFRAEKAEADRERLAAENATLAAERDSAALRCAELTAERDAAEESEQRVRDAYVIPLRQMTDERDELAARVKELEGQVVAAKQMFPCLSDEVSNYEDDAPAAPESEPECGCCGLPATEYLDTKLPCCKFCSERCRAPGPVEESE